MWQPRTLAGRVFYHELAVIVALLACAGFAVYSQAEQAALDASRDKVLAVAETLAANRSVSDALRRPDPTTALQPLAEQVRRETATDFIVIMNRDGVRYTHPNPGLIGGRFVGTMEPAVNGRPVTETYTGTLGPSVRAVVPIEDAGTVRGLVAVGITVEAIDRRVRDELPVLIIAAVVALLLAFAGYLLVNRWLRRATHDLGPADLSRMYEFYNAVLHAVREGLLLLDRQGRLQLANEEARRLLELPAEANGRRIDDLGLPAALARALAAGEEQTDEVYLTGDRVLVVSQAIARRQGTALGTVVTLRDQTELRALTTELSSIRGLSDALHAQAHEAANQLHTVISLIELGRTDEALRYAAAELELVQRLTDQVLDAVAEPVLAALLLGKVAEASECGVTLSIDEDAVVPAGVADPRDLVTIMGNLIDNAIDAARSAPEPRWVKVGAAVVETPTNGADRKELVLRVADSGCGLDPDDAVLAFQRGWSTKPADRLPSRGLGLSLVEQAVHRCGGSIEVSRERGAVFVVRLPLHRDNAHSSDALPRQRPGSTTDGAEQATAVSH